MLGWFKARQENDCKVVSFLRNNDFVLTVSISTTDDGSYYHLGFMTTRKYDMKNYTDKDLDQCLVLKYKWQGLVDWAAMIRRDIQKGSRDGLDIISDYFVACDCVSGCNALQFRAWGDGDILVSRYFKSGFEKEYSGSNASIIITLDELESFVSKVAAV